MGRREFISFLTAYSTEVMNKCRPDYIFYILTKVMNALNNISKDLTTNKHLNKDRIIITNLLLGDV